MGRKPSDPKQQLHAPRVSHNCELCGISLHSIKAMRDHLSGRRHRDNLAQTAPAAAAAPGEDPEEKEPIQILYMDDHLIAVLKPPGICVHPNRSSYLRVTDTGDVTAVEEDTALSRLAAQLQREQCGTDIERRRAAGRTMLSCAAFDQHGQRRQKATVSSVSERGGTVGGVGGDHQASENRVVDPVVDYLHARLDALEMTRVAAATPSTEPCETRCSKAEPASPPTLYPAHRLDQATSGVLLFARSKDSVSKLSLLFRKRLVKKLYLAVSRGWIHKSAAGTSTMLNSVEGEHSEIVEGFIDTALQVKEDGRKQRRRRAHNKRDGKVETAQNDALATAQFEDAQTSWRLLECADLSTHATHARGKANTQSCLVALTPRTGRKHQLRRHLAGIAHPIIGDREHGDRKVNQMYESQLKGCRLMLHARTIQFEHPFTKVPVSITAPLCDDMLAAFGVFGWSEDDADYVSEIADRPDTHIGTLHSEESEEIDCDVGDV